MRRCAKEMPHRRIRLSFDRVGEAIFAIAVRHENRGTPDIRTGIAHGNVSPLRSNIAPSLPPSPMTAISYFLSCGLQRRWLARGLAFHKFLVG
jgi:hypothetical protein